MGIAGLFKVGFLPYVLVIPIILFQALSLSGCVSKSPSLPDLYIVSFSRNDTSPPISLRVGYFGICAGNASDIRCQPTIRASPETVLPVLFPGINGTGSGGTAGPKSKAKGKPSAESASQVQDLVSASLAIQSDIFIPLLAGSGLAFLAGLPFLFLLKRSAALRGPFPENPGRAGLFKTAALGAFLLSAVLAFTACLATSETSGALVASTRLVGDPNLVIASGTPLQVLQWLAFAFVLLFTVATPWLLRPSGGGGGGGDAGFETYDK